MARGGIVGECREKARSIVDGMPYDRLVPYPVGLEDIRVVSIAGRPEIADEELRDAWRRFHAEHAHISLIPRDDHVREHGGS